jgi:hypothetical protein
MKRKSEDDALSVRENQALCLLAAGYEIKEVSEKLGIGRKTIYEWKARPNFQKLLNKAVMLTYDAAIAELIGGAEFATSELIKIIKNDDTPSRVKVSAINTLLTYTTKAKESYLINQRDIADDALTEASLSEYESVDTYE